MSFYDPVTNASDDSKYSDGLVDDLSRSIDESMHTNAARFFCNALMQSRHRNLVSASFYAPVVPSRSRLESDLAFFATFD